MQSLAVQQNVRNFALQSESSAVGSALRSGRRGRAFESPLSDLIRCGYAAADFFAFSREGYGALFSFRAIWRMRFGFLPGTLLFFVAF